MNSANLSVRTSKIAGLISIPRMCLAPKYSAGKNVAAAAHANDRDVAGRLHQIGGVDDVVLQVGELGDIAIIPGDHRAGARVDVEKVLVDFHLRRVGEAPAERNGVAAPSLSRANRCSSARTMFRSAPRPWPRRRRDGFCPEAASPVWSAAAMASAKAHGAAQAQGAGFPGAAHHHPAGAGGESPDPQRRADRIDHQQDEDDPETSERRAGKIGRVEPAAGVRQASEQQSDAEAAFGERHYEGRRGERQSHRHEAGRGPEAARTGRRSSRQRR